MKPVRNSLFDTYLTYLQKATPHRIWHYVSILLVVVVALAFSLREYNRGQSGDYSAVQMATGMVLLLYWLVQVRAIQSAIRITQYDWQSELADELVGTISQRRIIWTKVRAIFWHYRYVIILITLAVLCLSLAITGYTLAHGRYHTIIRYVGAIHPGWEASQFQCVLIGSSCVPFALPMGIALLALTVTNLLLSVSIGLWAGNLRRAIPSRLLLLGITIGIFVGLYVLRGLPPWSCGRAYWQSDPCPGIYVQQLLIDSFQAVTLSFVDGGAAMVSGLYGCGIRRFLWNGSQGRHLMAVGTTLVIQLTISGYLLWRSSFSIRKKKSK
jgi:hypothetical protein